MKEPENTGEPTHVQIGNIGEVGKSSGDTEDSTSNPDVSRHGRQENLTTAEPEDPSSPTVELLTESRVRPAQQGPTESFSRRLQLYGRRGEKLSNIHLSNPSTWLNIAYIRPGWVPNTLPFLHLGKQYWVLKDNSTIVSSSDLANRQDPLKEKVACRVTRYDHVEGPWCEVLAEDGARICILAAAPQSALI